MNNSKKWLEKAEADLSDASISQMSLDNRLYHCQQAAEKAIKAVLVFNEVEYPYTHDIGKLLEQVEATGIDFQEELREAVILTKYAVETRYPSMREITREDKEYRKAKQIAESIVKWAGTIIEK